MLSSFVSTVLPVTGYTLDIKLPITMVAIIFLKSENFLYMYLTDSRVTLSPALLPGTGPVDRELCRGRSRKVSMLETLPARLI